MKLITKLSILLLINFMACSTEQEDWESQCEAEYNKKVACFRLGPDSTAMFRYLNRTAATFTGSEYQISSLRSRVRGYCQSMSTYYECWENLELIPQCNPNNGGINTENRKLDEKIARFVVKYACQNDGETLLKITANNGLKPLIDNATGEAFSQCFEVLRNSAYLVANENYCRHAGTLTDCFLQYTDPMPNQDISGLIRDLTPQLKVLLNCDAFTA